MTEAATRWLARYGLVPAEPVPCPVAELVDAARIHKFTGLLARAVADGAAPVTDEERAAVYALAASGARRSVDIEARLAAFVERCTARGLTPIVLKGCAVAHLDHAEPADREFIDADLLVRGDQLAGVIALLGEEGYRRNLPERRPRFDIRFGKDITMQRGPDLEFDLHVRPAFGAFGQRVPLAEPGRLTEPVMVAGVPMVALAAADRLVHACFNAVLADQHPKPSAARDVALMVTSRKVTLAELRERAAAWRGEVVVAEAVRRVWSDLELPVEGDIARWALERRPTRRERVLLRTYPSQGGAFAVCLLAGVAGVPGWRQRVAYLAAFARPSAEYRSARASLVRVNEYREGLRQFAQVFRRRG